VYDGKEDETAMGFQATRFICRCFASISLLVSSCGPLNKIADEVPTTTRTVAELVQAAIDALNTNSASWQATLDKLQTDLRGTGDQWIAEVEALAKRGIATTGTELRCNADFVGARMKEGLAVILAKINGTQAPSIVPVYCQVVPEIVDMASRPTHISFYGYNFDRGVQVTLVSDAGEEDVSQYLALPTHYLATLQVGVTSGMPLCNKTNRRIFLKSQHDGAVLSSVDVIQLQCPQAPPRPPRAPERPVFSTEQNFSGGAFGISENHHYASACSSGYVRSVCQASKVNGNGNCYPGDKSGRPETVWLEGDERSCRCQVHVGAPLWGGVRCKIEVFEIGEIPPEPQAPPCPCW
jgi:hypothetical protein